MDQASSITSRRGMTARLSRPLTLKEAASAIGISHETLKRAEREGRIARLPREIGGDDRALSRAEVALLRQLFNPR